MTAATRGHVQCVKSLCLAHEDDTPSTESLVEASKRARMLDKDDVVSWLTTTYPTAGHHGLEDVDCLKTALLDQRTAEDSNWNHLIGFVTDQEHMLISCPELVQVLLTPHYIASEGHMLEAVQANDEKLVSALAKRCRMTPRTAQAAKDVTMLRLLHDLNAPWDAETPAAAARAGDVNRLRYALDNKCVYDSRVTLNACLAGSKDALLLAREFGCPWHGGAALAAAECRNMECLEVAVDDASAPAWDLSGIEEVLIELVEARNIKLVTAVAKRCRMTPRTAQAAKDVTMLRILHDLKAPWDAETPAAAARAGDVDRLRYALDNKCAYDSRVTLNACLAGSEEALLVARKFGCPWHDGAPLAAARGHHIGCLEIAVKDATPPRWDPPAMEDVLIEAVTANDTKAVTDLAKYCAMTPRTAVAAQDLAMLKLLNGLKAPWDAETPAAAARAGDVERLRFALDSGCQFDSRVTLNACSAGFDVALSLARDFNCPWDDGAALAAAKGRHMKCLEIAVKDTWHPMWKSPGVEDVLIEAVKARDKDLVTALAKGCRMTQRTALAAKDVDMLSLLHGLNAPWDVETPAAAALAGDVDRLRFALEKGCTVDSRVTLNACWAGSEAALQLARRCKPPWHACAALAAAKRQHMGCLEIAIKDASAPMWDVHLWGLNTLEQLTEGRARRPNGSFYPRRSATNSRSAMMSTILLGQAFPAHVVGADIWLRECKRTAVLSLVKYSKSTQIREALRMGPLTRRRAGVGQAPDLAPDVLRKIIGFTGL